ncbi:hypothetical protein RGU12_09130 [Fredinandcohnia sp. QZ13]|uniref:hypothetical protein n=1 Tax=Fredinandcohnia sp. QZ13 TaxID=3073144 RepID=UPI00285361AD|nr:hypothetical protein [Fredinandcohnia sp. QZ13]MDR4887708.1 hypothetical protein [Fredinandcohnia sp. QZ13]
MDERTQELIELTKNKFGLWDYSLKRSSYNRSVNIFNETVYTLSMEWFPNHVLEPVDEDENPDGTAVIEIDIHSRKFQSAIFVMGQTFAKNGVTFASKNDIINWIEQETGLRYEQQFQLRKEEEGELHFTECIGGVDVSPSGMIEVNYNQEGNLTLFSVHGHFPSKERVELESYTLPFEKIEDIAKEQLKLLEFPLFDQQRLVAAYAVEEIYVRNDQISTIPFEPIVDVKGYLKVDKPLSWDEPLRTMFERKEMKWHEEVTAEQASSNEPSPDSLPITEAEQEKCVRVVRDFLRQEYPNDSGIWIIRTLHRENGYIHAILRATEQDSRVFQRKVNIMIDSKNHQVINYMDNLMMLKMFEEFEIPEKVVISKDEAFEKLKGKYELTPCYVYDFDQKQYVLCGKIDCQFGVNAATGDVVGLEDI